MARISNRDITYIKNELYKRFPAEDKPKIKHIEQLLIDLTDLIIEDDDIISMLLKHGIQRYNRNNKLPLL